MTNNNFWKSKYITVYICKSIGYLWFRIFSFNFSIKNINKYGPNEKKPKGIKLGQWIITIIK